MVVTPFLTKLRPFRPTFDLSLVLIIILIILDRQGVSSMLAVSSDDVSSSHVMAEAVAGGVTNAKNFSRIC